MYSYPITAGKTEGKQKQKHPNIAMMHVVFSITWEPLKATGTIPHVPSADVSCPWRMVASLHIPPPALTQMPFPGRTETKSLLAGKLGCSCFQTAEFQVSR